jgi:hypothetical protein
MGDGTKMHVCVGKIGVEELRETAEEVGGLGMGSDGKECGEEGMLLIWRVKRG